MGEFKHNASQIFSINGGSDARTSYTDAVSSCSETRTLDAEEIMLNIDLERVKDLLGKLPVNKLEFLEEHLKDVITCVERERFRRT